MPLYYFGESGNPDDLGLDAEGLEFDNNRDACDESVRALREMAACDSGPTIWISVFDADRRLLFRTRLDVTQEAST